MTHNNIANFSDPLTKKTRTLGSQVRSQMLLDLFLEQLNIVEVYKNECLLIYKK